MTQLVGLFSNQTDAEQAMTALAAIGVQQSDLQMMVVTPNTAVATAFNLKGQTAQRFQQKAQNGGVLIIIESPTREITPQAQEILENQNSLIVAEGEPKHD